VNNGVAIAPVQVDAGSQCCHAGIARSDKKIGKQRTLANAPGKGRLPTTRAKDEYVHKAKVGLGPRIPKRGRFPNSRGRNFEESGEKGIIKCTKYTANFF